MIPNFVRSLTFLGAFFRSRYNPASRSAPYVCVILDRYGKFGEEVTDVLTASDMKPKRISPASPWQHGVVERWIGSCRGDLLDNLLTFNEAHPRRLTGAPSAIRKYNSRGL